MSADIIIVGMLVAIGLIGYALGYQRGRSENEQ